MSTTHNVKRVIAGALLSLGFAVAGSPLTAGTAHAFDPQPDPPAKPTTSSVNPAERLNLPSRTSLVQPSDSVAGRVGSAGSTG
jgi:hypothetical protein